MMLRANQLECDYCSVIASLFLKLVKFTVFCRHSYLGVVFDCVTTNGLQSWQQILHFKRITGVWGRKSISKIIFALTPGNFAWKYP